MIRSKPHFYQDVPRIGNLAFTKHAEAELRRDNVSQDEIEKVLLYGTDTPDGASIVWRRFKGIRLVINRRPEPDLGASVVLTGYREQRQHAVKQGRGRPRI